MIQNHIPSYETCVRLKELWFPQQTVYYYSLHGQVICTREILPVGNGFRTEARLYFGHDGSKYNPPFIAAPLLSELVPFARTQTDNISTVGLAFHAGRGDIEGLAHMVIEYLESKGGEV